MQKVTPFLWFDGKAEEAMNFYVSVFKNAEDTRAAAARRRRPGDVGHDSRSTGSGSTPSTAGRCSSLSEAVSLFVNCETQDEVDELWDKLGDGGTPQRCGWLKDKIGLSWQIIPSVLGKRLQDKDPEKAQRVVQAMLGMIKIDIDRESSGPTTAKA